MVLFLDLADQVIDLQLLLVVLHLRLLAGRLLPRNLLLVHYLHSLALLHLLDVELVNELQLLQPLVLHVLRDDELADAILVRRHLLLHELLRALLCDLSCVQPLFQVADLLAAVADAALLHLLANARRLLLGELVRQPLLRFNDLRASFAVLLSRHMLVVGEEVTLDRCLRARASQGVDAVLAARVACEDVGLYKAALECPLLVLQSSRLENALLCKEFCVARHDPGPIWGKCCTLWLSLANCQAGQPSENSPSIRLLTST
mmetsp:Transcript_17979/g.41975  ORF Transcript_17979/g.41975 Transcript_17979/m.41975 type:complete len:261 (+) Transcript_17979:926-1708(+)